MNKKPTEEDIQKMLKVLEETDPESATREKAIEMLENFRGLASKLLDQIDDDLKTGKTRVENDGAAVRDENCDED